MTAQAWLKAEIELRQAILAAITKAAKDGLDSDQIKAILDQVGETVENYGTED